MKWLMTTVYTVTLVAITALLLTYSAMWMTQNVGGLFDVTNFPALMMYMAFWTLYAIYIFEPLIEAIKWKHKESS